MHAVHAVRAPGAQRRSPGQRRIPSESVPTRCEPFGTRWSRLAPVSGNPKHLAGAGQKRARLPREPGRMVIKPGPNCARGTQSRLHPRGIPGGAADGACEDAQRTNTKMHRHTPAVLVLYGPSPGPVDELTAQTFRLPGPVHRPPEQKHAPVHNDVGQTVRLGASRGSGAEWTAVWVAGG